MSKSLKTESIHKYFVNILRFLGRVLICLFSCGWLLPLIISYNFMIESFVSLAKLIHTDTEAEIAFKSVVVSLKISRGQFSLSVYWLCVVIFFWCYIASIKLWPKKRS